MRSFKATLLWDSTIPPLALTTITKRVVEGTKRHSTEWFLFCLPADEALVDVCASVLGVALVALGALGARLGPRPVAVRLAALVARRAQQLLLVLVRVVVALAAPAMDHGMIRIEGRPDILLKTSLDFGYY